MVISKYHKFLFIHVPKNAGSSITFALRNHGDIISEPTKHETLAQIEARYDLTGYKIFAFVRNPWERLYSFYNYMEIRGKLPQVKSFEQFVDMIRHNDKRIMNWKTIKYQQNDYFKSDKHRVDFVGRVDKININWEMLSDYLILGLPKLTKINRYSRGYDYRREYSDADRKFVENYYNEDVIEFGYTFDK